MKFIEKILMASEDVKSYLVSGVCKDKELADGSLVEIGDLIDHEVYKGLKDMNTREIKPYAGTGRVGKLGDEFYLGEDNFESAPTAGQFAIAGSDGQWAPVAVAADDKLCVKVEFGKDKIIGVKNEGKKFYCTVIHE